MNETYINRKYNDKWDDYVEKGAYITAKSGRDGRWKRIKSTKSILNYQNNQSRKSKKQ
jgi:hypothetical protein